MSWSCSLTAVEPGADVLALINEKVDSYNMPRTPELDDQVAAASAIGAQLIESGVVGPGPHHVNVSGHANPGHEPTQGWANDTVTVTVSDARVLAT